MIIAVTKKVTELPFKGYIEFYHAFNSVVTEFPTVFKLKFQLEATHLHTYESAQFSNGDFVYQRGPLAAPQIVRLCSTTEYLDPVTRLCK